MSYHYNKRVEPPSVKRDKKFGDKGERKFQQYMLLEFNHEIEKAEDESHYCDFYDHNRNIVYEVKSRKNHLKTYPDSPFGKDKIDRFEEFNSQNGYKYRFFIIFNFYDGFYYFEHKQGTKYKTHNFNRNQIKGWHYKRKPYIFVPITLMKPIDNLPKDINHKLLVRYNM